MTPPRDAQAPITLFYDGGCALCLRQVAWLKRHPHRQRIRFVDIRAQGFVAESWGRHCDELMGRLYALDGQGRWFAGMDASRALYSVLGHSYWVGVSSLPGLRQLLDRLYLVAAKHRNRLGKWLDSRQ